MEHRLLLGGGEQFLPFARSCITKLKKLNLAYADQSFEVDGASIKVRIEPGHEYIMIEGGRRFDYSYNYVSDMLPDPLASVDMRMAIKAAAVDGKVKKHDPDAVTPPLEKLDTLTDWKGDKGTVLLYSTGLATRYRVMYPTGGLPASADILYGGKALLTGGKFVIGAAILKAESGNKHLIYAGYMVTTKHITRFYSRRLDAAGIASDGTADAVVGDYSPYTSDPAFDSDISYQPTSYTWPNPWHFSGDGAKAVSTVIRPNLRHLLHGFVAHVSFSVQDGSEGETVVMSVGATSNQTAPNEVYASSTSVSSPHNEYLINSIVTTVSKFYYDESYTSFYYRTVTVTNASAANVGHSRLEGPGELVEMLLGAEFNHVGELQVLTSEVGAIHFSDTVSTITSSLGPGTQNTTYAPVSPPAEEHRFGGETTTVQYSVWSKINVSSSGIEKINKLKVNGGVVYAMDSPGDTQRYRSDLYSSNPAVPPIYNSTWSIGIKEKNVAFILMDIRDNTFLAIEVRSEQKQTSYSNQAEPGTHLSPVSSSSVWFVAKGVAPREVLCSDEYTNPDDAFVLGPVHFNSTTVGFGSMGALLGANLERIVFFAWLVGLRKKAFGCSARQGELFYCVDVDVIKSALLGIAPSPSLTSRALSPNVKILDDKRIQVCLAKKKKDGSVVEGKLIPYLPLPADKTDLATLRMEHINLISKR